MPMIDTVFDCDGKPVFYDDAVTVRRRLLAVHPPHWVKVFISETNETVLITEYLYRDKYTHVVKQIKELLRKKDLPMYKREPETYERHIERAARRMIQKILEDEAPR